MCPQRRAGILLAALAWSSMIACGGQLAPARTQPAAPAPGGARTAGPPAVLTAPTGTLGGTVVGEPNRQPLARARIVLTSPTLEAPRVALSDADGRYRFAHLPAAAYLIEASRSGYAPQQYGARRAGAPSDPVRLGEGESRTNIDFALAAAGLIAGVILDEDGEPFDGAIVEALLSRMDAGQPTLVTAATARTDERGAFRLTGLAAADYYVSALDPAFAHAGDETGPLHYRPTFYPGVTLAEQATRVAVSPAGPASPISFALKIVRPARVTGVMSAEDGRRLRSGSLVMTPLDVEALVTIATEDVKIHTDGTFVFRDVPPGRYQIRARGEVDPESVALFATYGVIVAGQDIAGVQLILQPGALVSGLVTAEGERAAPPAGLRVRAPLADGTASGDALTGDVRSDGTYSIRGVRPGPHRITVEGLRDPWVVKRVTYRGQDVTDGGVEADSRQRLDNVVVTITDLTSDISGMVHTPAGAAAGDAMVLIIPRAEQFWARRGRRFGVLRTDAGGRYRLRGLPPGEYRVIAARDLDETELHRIDLLRTLSAAGVPLTIAGVEEHVLDLPLSSSKDLGRASAR